MNAEYIATVNLAADESWLHKLTNPIDLLTTTELHHWIIPTIVVMVFVETGLLFPFLPGDSLLFAGGILAATRAVSLPALLILVPLAACAGDQTAYWIGRYIGPKLFNRPDSRFFKHEYLERAHEFFERNGKKAVILARFVPIVRTFSAVVAGTSKMNYRLFVLFDAIGGILWGSGITFLGFLLGNNTFIRKNIELFFIVVVFITIIPGIVKYFKHRKTNDPYVG